MPGAQVYDRGEAPFQTSTTGDEHLESLVRAMVRSMHMQENPLSQAFFSVDNLNAIQKDIQSLIRRRTGYVIDRQSDDSMLAIMRYVYVRDGSNVPPSVKDEVRRLNGLVVHEAAPIVASGLAQYLAYVRDASQMPNPLPRAQQTSVKGTKTTELFRPL